MSTTSNSLIHCLELGFLPSAERAGGISQRKKKKDKTASSIRYGLFQFKANTFTLSNVPVTFERL